MNWIALGFTEQAEKRQAQLEELFPDVGVVAVPVDWTRLDLRRLQRRVGDELFPSVITSGGISVDAGRGMVELSVGVVTDEVVEAAAHAFAGEPLCITGRDPADLPAPGPQAISGDGWTLLGYRQKDGPPWFRTGLATRPGQFARLWDLAEMPGICPRRTSIVTWSCGSPPRMARVAPAAASMA